MREGFIHIRIDVPPAGRGSTWREWALLAFRPFWPLTRWALELRQRISIVAQHMFRNWTQALADAGLPPLDQIPKAP